VAKDVSSEIIGESEAGRVQGVGTIMGEAASAADEAQTIFAGAAPGVKERKASAEWHPPYEPPRGSKAWREFPSLGDKHQWSRPSAAEARAEWMQLWQSSDTHKEVFGKVSADFHNQIQESRMPYPKVEGKRVTMSSMPIRPTLARRLAPIIEEDRRLWQNATWPDLSPNDIVGAAPLGGGPKSGIRSKKSGFTFEDNQFMAATCFFDVWQGLQYVAYAGLGIYYITLGGNDLDKTENWLNVIATFNWIGSFLASAASDCQIGLEPTPNAGCASCVMWVVGNIPQLAADAIGVYQDCTKFNQGLPRRLANNATSPEDHAAMDPLTTEQRQPPRAADEEARRNAAVSDDQPRRLRVSNGAPFSASRDASITSCFFDANAAISFFARFGLQIKTDQTDCKPDNINTVDGRTNCAMDVIYTIDNFGWAAEYVMQLFADCPAKGWDNQVYCLEDATDLAWSGSGMAAAVEWTRQYCGEVVAEGGPSAVARKDVPRPVPGLYGEYQPREHGGDFVKPKGNSVLR
jgi:hypothetical protein